MAIADLEHERGDRSGSHTRSQLAARIVVGLVGQPSSSSSWTGPAGDVDRNSSATTPLMRAALPINMCDRAERLAALDPIAKPACVHVCRFITSWTKVRAAEWRGSEPKAVSLGFGRAGIQSDNRNTSKQAQSKSSRHDVSLHAKALGQLDPGGHGSRSGRRTTGLVSAPLARRRVAATLAVPPLPRPLGGLARESAFPFSNRRV
jgi:hypothetical protein